MKISKIIIYCDTQIAKEIDLTRLDEFLKRTFPVQLEHVNRHIFHNNTQQEIRDTLIDDIKKPPRYIASNSVQKTEPKMQTINKDSSESISIYDGFELCDVALKIIDRDESNTTSDSHKIQTQQHGNILHVIFTDMTTCTFDESDYRYHARMLTGANQCIISISGIVDGPARPREYYIRQMTKRFTAHMSNTTQDSDDNHNSDTCDNAQDTLQNTDNYITRHDVRIPYIVQGLLLQAVTYYETGEVFCTDKSCRLYNSHWQSEMIYTQITNQKLCSKHYNVIKNMQSTTK